MIYFTSDLHFGHQNIINLCHRPFKNIDQMDSQLIRNWNNEISKDDEVYILGDFTMKSSEMAHIYFSSLNGKKYLIRGNHDTFVDEYKIYMDDVQWIKYYFVLKYENYKFVLFHYPILTWESSGKGSIHLYGHIHNDINMSKIIKNCMSKNSLNVGTDLYNYTPISIEQIKEYLKKGH